jgi:hypothetical protein
MGPVERALRDALAKVMPRGGLCRADYAQDKNGKGVNCRDARAVSFCPIGAIHSLPLDRETELEATFALGRTMGGDIGRFTILHPANKVLAAWREAIRLAALQGPAP